MKNLITGAIALTALGGLGSLLVLKNPGEQAYREHLAWQIRDEVCDQKELSLADRANCTMLAVAPPKAIETLLSPYTRRQNYTFFSIYRTEFMGLKTKTIGVAGHFFGLE
ncbi:MAG: DUF4359 domain-containing protein [Oscillatoria sp. SIO1A7]|nr:DUF4359 domain-containing protein [Oscillatoria sp. SIO1A7]